MACPIDSERTVYKAAEGVDKLRGVSGYRIVLKEITSNISIRRRESVRKFPEYAGIPLHRNWHWSVTDNH